MAKKSLGHSEHSRQGDLTFGRTWTVFGAVDRADAIPNAADLSRIPRKLTVAADKAKTAAQRLVPIQPNLKAWLELHRGKGAVIDPQERRNMIRAWGADWPKNGLRHSYISYRLAVTKDVAATAMEAGNSAPIIFKHYRELVKPDQGAAWFGIQPLDGASENLYKA